MRALHLCVLAASAALPASAFYLPGVAPQSWRDGESVQVKADSLTSTKTRIPYDYYSFPFCKPEKQTEEGETLGEVLAGARMETTTYDVAMGVNAKCRVLCQVNLGEKEIKQMKMLIDQQYAVNLVVDNLPGVMKYDNLDNDSQDDVMFGLGYWVGGIIMDDKDLADAASGSSGSSDRQRRSLRSDSAASGRGLQGETVDSADSISSITFDEAAKTYVNADRFINNHVNLKLWWHKPASTDTVMNEWGVNGRRLEEGGDSDPKRIVRFEVQPLSYQHHYDTKLEVFDPQTVTTCTKTSEMYAAIGNGQNQLLKFKEKSQKIIYSYSVE